MGLLRRSQPRASGLQVAGLTIDDVTVLVKIRRNARARRMILRLAPDGDGVVLTLPPRVSEQDGLAFARRNSNWILSRLNDQAERVEFHPGQILPFRGEPHVISHGARARGLVHADYSGGEARLVVHGEIAHLARRLADWLKRQAKAELAAASDRYAQAMGVRYRRLAVRDQKSRWGSCTSDGRLSYSWRLILTPPHVLDYVAAHEVAHLIEMNHSDRFWAVVALHCPHWREARRWLKTNGAALHRYGA
ncbi:M48 family metallopeptidase [Rhodoligotrophos defluvii]|uniref:M48 family metallopeptidase n=1 Tax=Rhodoligotrophos defluvii TaxID=2561934 RepID=UPI0010C9C216|nr:SprT family zinc-dependent metalloprotease [Rhodoligotrophos defluvii]